MTPKVSFLSDGRRRSRAPSPRSSSPLEEEISLSILEPSDPQQSLMFDFIRSLACTHQTSLYERRAENKKQHHKRACRDHKRDVTTKVHACLEKIERLLQSEEPKLKKLKSQIERLPRFVGKGESTEGKKAADAWVYGKFFFLLLVLPLVICSGTIAMSAVMLDHTAYAGTKVKAYLAALGMFLLPSIGLYIPFFLLHKTRKKLSYVYLVLLVLGASGVFLLFVLTWAHTYAIETGNATLMDILTLGTGDVTPEPDHGQQEHQHWLFREASWLSLVFQVLADMAFAASAKGMLDLLTASYCLFRPHAFPEDPEWVRLTQEIEDLTCRIAELKAKKKHVLGQMENLDEQEEDFAEMVCSLADAMFLEEVDKFEQAAESIRRKEQQIQEKENAWRKSQQELEDLQTQHPGALRTLPQSEEQP